MSIGHNIREQRMKMKMTQDDVARKMQLKGFQMMRDYYAHIENGSYNIRISELAALRQVFNCTFDDFFIGIE